MHDIYMAEDEVDRSIPDVYRDVPEELDVTVDEERSRTEAEPTLVSPEDRGANGVQNDVLPGGALRHAGATISRVVVVVDEALTNTNVEDELLSVVSSTDKTAGETADEAAQHVKAAADEPVPPAASGGGGGGEEPPEGPPPAAADLPDEGDQPDDGESLEPDYGSTGFVSVELRAILVDKFGEAKAATYSEYLDSAGHEVDEVEGIRDRLLAGETTINQDVVDRLKELSDQEVQNPTPAVAEARDEVRYFFEAPDDSTASQPTPKEVLQGNGAVAVLYGSLQYGDPKNWDIDLDVVLPGDSANNRSEVVENLVDELSLPLDAYWTQFETPQGAARGGPNFGIVDYVEDFADVVELLRDDPEGLSLEAAASIMTGVALFPEDAERLAQIQGRIKDVIESDPLLCAVTNKVLEDALEIRESRRGQAGSEGVAASAPLTAADPEGFADDLSSIGRRMGVTQKELAEYAGVSDQTINRLMRGRTGSREVFEKILERLQLPPEEAERRLALYDNAKTANMARAITEASVSRTEVERTGVGPDLNAMRRDRGVTRAQLAEAAGVGTATIDRMFRNAGSVDPSIVEKVVERLGLSHQEARGLIAQHAQERESLSPPQPDVELGVAANLINAARARVGISIPQLAARAGTSTSTVEKLFSGRSYTDPAVVSRMCAVLGMDEDEAANLVSQYSQERSVWNARVDQRRREQGQATRRREREDR